METVVIDGVSRTSALPADAVATRIADEFAAEGEPLHVRIGADAGRMIAAVEAGEREYHRYLVEDLGFSWLPLGRADAGERQRPVCPEGRRWPAFRSRDVTMVTVQLSSGGHTKGSKARAG